MGAALKLGLGGQEADGPAQAAYFLKLNFMRSQPNSGRAYCVVCVPLGDLSDATIQCFAGDAQQEWVTLPAKERQKLLRVIVVSGQAERFNQPAHASALMPLSCHQLTY